MVGWKVAQIVPCGCVSHEEALRRPGYAERVLGFVLIWGWYLR
jgi:hypothetical protein